MKVHIVIFYKGETEQVAKVFLKKNYAKSWCEDANAHLEQTAPDLYARYDVVSYEIVDAPVKYDEAKDAPPKTKDLMELLGGL